MSEAKEAKRDGGCLPRLVLPFELGEVDADIQEHFAEDVAARYVPKLPILIQISRQLRRLLNECDDGKDGANDCEKLKDEVEAENAARQLRLGRFVTVDRVGKRLGSHDADGTLDLLVQLGAGLRVVAESLDQLSGLHVDIPAALRCTHRSFRQNATVEAP